MADNSNKTILSRLSRSGATVPGVVVPPMPRLPRDFVRRFPEWNEYQAEMDRWRESLQQELGKALTQEK